MINLKFLLSVGILLSLTAKNGGVEECCPTKDVRNSRNNLDGTYNLIPEGERGQKDSRCKDDCVYKKNGDSMSEYCFKAVPHEVAPDVECVDCERDPHPCNRDCTNTTPMNCTFTFTTELQETNQPGRQADGRVRHVTTYNGKLPGPLLVVCQDDTVEVTLVNNIIDGPVTNSDGSPNTTTLHFHGIRNVGVANNPIYAGFGPWSDGTPFVTQCPVPGADAGSRADSKSSDNVFVYKFKADEPGTYWYHSHLGAQRTNGLAGGLIIKDKNLTHPYHEAIDDPDCQKIILQEWYVSPTCIVPVSILVNGKSRIGDMIHTCTNETAVNSYLKGHGAKFQKIPHNPKRDLNPTHTQYEIFSVKPDQTYRFRVIGLIGQNFPIRFSIDEHKFSAVATDSRYIEEVKNLTNLWISAGERYDILLKTKNSSNPTAFKMRFIGFGDITDSTSAVCSIAWLKYPNQNIQPDYITPHNCSDFDLLVPSHYPPASRTLNSPGISHYDWTKRLKVEDWRDRTKVGSIYPVDLRSLVGVDSSDTDSSDTQFIEFSPSTSFNGIRTSYPNVPYLLQTDSTNPQPQRCTVDTKDAISSSCDNTGTYCVCPHVLQFRYEPKKWVEIILISNNQLVAHPIHQHGGWFWVVGGDVLQSEPNREFIIREHRENKLVYNTDREMSIPKDVIQVPRNGYVILRTKLDNPGTWFLHCHIDFHLSVGMALVMQIGVQGDWNLGPLENQIDEPCPEQPPYPLGGGARINWIFQKMVLAHPPIRCVPRGEVITFFWIDPDYELNGPNDAPYDDRDHNVNYIGTGSEAGRIYENCDLSSPLPSGDNLKTKPDTPNQEITIPITAELGWHYFFCSLNDHCINHNVKAKVKVVEDIRDCHIHHYNY